MLLAGLILLLLVIFLGVFTWLWTSNSKNTNPLPIMSDDSLLLATDNEESDDAVANSVLHLQAADVLQIPLDNVIVRFESRYPKVQILARYVPVNSLLTLPDTIVSADQPSPLVVNTDMIIADSKLTQNQLTNLQALLNKAQVKADQTLIKGVTSNSVENVIQDTVQASSDDSNINTPANIAKSTNDETRNLVSFSYALKSKQSIDGVILTNNPAAITFRNFLLSSTGQDILKQYDYDNIDGYKSSVDDLFNPTTRGKTASGDDSVKVADALSNGE